MQRRVSFHAAAAAFILTLAISLRVSPLISFAPSTLTIQVRVQPDPSDRQVQVIVDGEHYSRLSRWDIEPATAPHLFSWALKDLPPGNYEVLAQIGSWSAVRASDRQTVEIR